MRFNHHVGLEGTHAFLSPSKHYWTTYDDEKFLQTYNSWQAANRGTELHKLAADLIRLGVKLPRTSKTLNMYVNDCLGFRMKTEVCLFYSYNCYGTADAISFRKNELRISDLKTGKSPCSIKQLEIYAALFCLEYKVGPNDIEIELRLYQSDEVLCSNPEPENILYIMQKIRDFDRKIEELKGD